MGDVHQVIDSDPHFKIDKTTRRIVDQSNSVYMSSTIYI